MSKIDKDTRKKSLKLKRRISSRKRSKSPRHPIEIINPPPSPNRLPPIPKSKNSYKVAPSAQNTIAAVKYHKNLILSHWHTALWFLHLRFRHPFHKRKSAMVPAECSRPKNVSLCLNGTSRCTPINFESCFHTLPRSAFVSCADSRRGKNPTSPSTRRTTSLLRPSPEKPSSNRTTNSSPRSSRRPNSATPPTAASVPACANDHASAATSCGDGPVLRRPSTSTTFSCPSRSRGRRLRWGSTFQHFVRGCVVTCTMRWRGKRRQYNGRSCVGRRG
mmetsp:Transcript_32779/g.60036  ORF Transcript_32779/g.60036 Transcript_32779/m.60036 type:complete len:275 (-) Transcript_32779:808-1632(-)